MCLEALTFKMAIKVKPEVKRKCNTFDCKYCDEWYYHKFWVNMRMPIMVGFILNKVLVNSEI